PKGNRSNAGRAGHWFLSLSRPAEHRHAPTGGLPKSYRIPWSWRSLGIGSFRVGELSEEGLEVVARAQGVEVGVLAHEGEVTVAIGDRLRKLSHGAVGEG